LEEEVNTSYAKAETLTSAVIYPLDWTRQIILVVAFSLLMALSAQFVIPLPWTPIPITGQTFVVLLAGALLGKRLGALAMIAYLIEGASGLPFFRAGSGGIGYLIASPTTGYLLSYPLAAFTVGLLAERGWDKRFWTAAAAMAFGSALILLGGWAWLSLWFKSPADAWRAGVMPFLAGDVIKIALAAAALPAGWAIVRRKASQQD
jgi:biotin transport system substrate-specific component